MVFTYWVTLNERHPVQMRSAMYCLPTDKKDLDGLSNQGVEIERVLLIAHGVIQVGECCQRLQYIARRIANLYLQGVEKLWWSWFPRYQCATRS